MLNLLRFNTKMVFEDTSKVIIDHHQTLSLYSSQVDKTKQYFLEANNIRYILSIGNFVDCKMKSVQTFDFEID